jgi:hypothetical protein
MSSGSTGMVHTTKQPRAALERSFEVTVSFLAKNVNLDRLGLVEGLEGHDGLYKERLGIFEVYMEEGHHCDRGEYTFDLVTWSTHVNDETVMNAHEFGCLSKVIIAYCGCNELPGLLRLGGTKHASGDQEILREP